MVTAPEEKDDEEPRYTAWLDLPISTREPMTAKDANAARKALLALDDRTPQQRLRGAADLALRAGAREPITRLPGRRVQ